MEYKDGLTDLKKRALDDFVRHFKSHGLVKKSQDLFDSSSSLTQKMSTVFVESDPLLVSVGMITIYYHLFREASERGWLREIKREALIRFDDERAQNRA